MKTLSYFVVGLLIISSLAAIGLGKYASVSEEKNLTGNIEQFFGNPQTIEKEIEIGTFIELTMENTNAVSYKSGEPLLPIYRQTIELPFGTTISDIEVNKKGVETLTLNEKILPAPELVLQGMEDESKIEYKPADEIYNADQYYPEENYKYSIGAGLDDEFNHVNYLTLTTYPTRYNPVENKIEYTREITIDIEYSEPEQNPFKSTSEYDMVIIAPNKFSSKLNELVQHKNKYGIQTTIKTTEDIYDEYSGVDKPEKIKYFIKDAIETWDIKYVLLVGGLNSLIDGSSRDDENQGSKDWYVPVRYTNLQEMGGTHDPGFISDLYYADIYDSEGQFSSWDSDSDGQSDGIFAAWKTFVVPRKDIIDFYPDVIVGRLACRNTNEVETVVDKIIDYEKYKHKTDWYDTMVFIGGDSHNDAGTDFIEGEVAGDHVYSEYMDEYNPVKLYASNKDTNPNYIPSPEAIVREISKGCGHLLFEGHGNPGSWNTHWPGIFNWGDTPGGISIADIPKISNGGIKQPVCVIGGCHNSQFNVTLAATLAGEKYMWTYGVPVPECFSWHFVRKIGGGSIASFGNTGLGYGAVGENGDVDGDGINLPDTLEAVGGYQISLFYETFDEGKDILGQCWEGSIRKYLNTFPGMEDQTDAKTVEQWPMLGDPSLKIGGYQDVGKSKTKDFDNYQLPTFIKELLDRIQHLPLVQFILENIKIITPKL